MVRGKKFNFLRMDVVIRKDKKIEITMMKHIKEALDWFGKNITENP